MTQDNQTQEQNKAKEKLTWTLTIVVLVLLIVVPPMLCGLLYLSSVPDITWGDDEGLSFTRIWLHRDKGAKGIGYQNQRVLEEYSNTEACVETRLRFLLWGQSRKAQPSTSSRELIYLNNRWQPNGEACH